MKEAIKNRMVQAIFELVDSDEGWTEPWLSNLVLSMFQGFMLQPDHIKPLFKEFAEYTWEHAVADDGSVPLDQIQYFIEAMLDELQDEVFDSAKRRLTFIYGDPKEVI